MKKIIYFLIFCLSITVSVAQKKQWKLIPKSDDSNKKELKVRENLPVKHQIYSLQIDDFQKEVRKSTSKIIELPTTNGIQQFTYQENSSLSPELAAKFPMIKSYVAQSVGNSSTNAVFSLGTNGLHAIIYSAGKSPYYLDSYSKNNKTYIGYYKKDLERSRSDFECKVEESFKKAEIANVAQRSFGDGMLRTFRLAVATTGEYSQFHLNQQNIDANATDAVKKAAILSAINTTITRVNGVFIRDLGVKMEIVANNDKIIFLDPATDGLSNSSSTSLINESQTKCDIFIGNANYDIGHTFSTGAGGQAALGSVCVAGQKARGVTGRSQPINDSFDIDFVAHEIGHQFGGNHTFNGTQGSCSGGNRNNSTAVEPGSGTTIMAYAGICGTDNVQGVSDDNFHAISITEMWNTILSSANCATLTPTGNNTPTANAGSDFSIPKSTPFVLKGTATDADSSNELSYNWEQIDAEVGFSIPIVSTNTGGAMFRSLPSKQNPVRYMPALATVVAGNTATTWEVLPSVARELNFSFVVRDNNPGGGSTKRDDMNIIVTDAEAFTVSAPNSAISWDVGSTQTVTWTKGTTDAAPINCQNVNIKLSIDGGLTFPIIIKENTPNDGTEDIVIPNNPSFSARIMVEAADNIFYNVNATNFTINSTTPTFVMTNTSGTQFACNTGNESASYVLNFDFVNGFSENVTFTTTGQPNGTSVTFNPNTINGDGNVTMTVSNFNGVTSQGYNIKINGNSNTVNQSTNVNLNVTNSSFGSLTLTTPANNETDVELFNELKWQADANASNYDVQIATDNGFTSIFSSVNVATNSYSVSGLSKNTTYYWRVKPKNSCGEGSFSNAFIFKTLTPTYCTSTFTDEIDGTEHITKVVFNTINNESINNTSGGYEDFTTIETNVKRGETHQISVTIDTGGYQDHCFVFIDWNQDYEFNTTTERYDLGIEFEDVGTRTFDITVPNDAVFGATRMRVIIEYTGSDSPHGEGACDADHQSEWGETEDYTIVVDNTASVEDFTFDSFNIFPNPTKGEFTLNLKVVNTDKVSVQLFDLRGRLIDEREYLNTITNFSERIFFDKASAGLYLLKVTNGAKQTTRKLFIK